MKLAELQVKSDQELLDFAIESGAVDEGANPRRMDILRKMFKIYSENEEGLDASGILSILNEGYGFLRQNSDQRGAGDVYVSQSQIRRFSLRNGDYVLGNVRPPKDGERYFGLVKVEKVNDTDPDSSRQRPKFESLTPIFPEEMIILETDAKQLSTRLMDIMSPVGRGQRGLIVSPPKAGKTTILKEIANGITENAPDIHIMVALIGERPEEVTDMKRSIKGEVYSSTFDEPVEDHCRVAELVLERSKRLVEAGSVFLAAPKNFLVPPEILKKVEASPFLLLAWSIREAGLMTWYMRSSRVRVTWKCIWTGRWQKDVPFQLWTYIRVVHAVKSSYWMKTPSGKYGFCVG